MRYTGKDSKNALKVRAQCFGVCFLLFNKAIPSFYVTSGKVLGEKEEPQHFYNKGFFTGKRLPVLLGSSCREFVNLKPPAAHPCSPGMSQKPAWEETRPGEQDWSCPTSLEAGCVGKNWPGAASVAPRAGDFQSCGSQVKRPCRGISLCRLLFTHSSIILPEQATGMCGSRAGNATVLRELWVGAQG